MCRSVPQMPHAATATTTSRGPGVGSGIDSTVTRSTSMTAAFIICLLNGASTAPAPRGVSAEGRADSCVVGYGPPGPPASPGRPSRAATPGSAGRSTANRSSSTRSPNSSRLRTNASGSSRWRLRGGVQRVGQPVDDRRSAHPARRRPRRSAPSAATTSTARSISPSCSRLCRITGSSHLGIRSELSAHSRATVSRTCGVGEPLDRAAACRRAGRSPARRAASAWPRGPCRRAGSRRTAGPGTTSCTSR